MDTAFFHEIYWGNTIEQYTWFAGIILAGILFKRIISKIISRILYRTFKKYAAGVGINNLIELLEKPFGIFVLLIAFYIAFDRLESPPEWHLVPKEKFGFRMLFFNTYKLGIILSFTWIILRCVDFMANVFLSLKNTRANKQLVPFAKDFVKVMIVIFSFFLILGMVFHLNIASIIAGLGIGGLAIALAAKEYLENLFGSFTIFLDKPFVVGDLIKTGDITGNVESIGFRTTRIRTLEKTFLSVPNKKIVESGLDNLTLRTSRRSKFVIKISNQARPEQLKDIVSDIVGVLKTHISINKNYSVFFNEFSSGAFDIDIDYYVNTLDYNEYAAVRQDINLKIMDIVYKHNCTFASPPQG